MPTFEIEQYELHAMKYRIDAEDEAEAIAKLLGGEGEPVDGSQEYVEVCGDRGLPADDYQELARKLRALGVPVKKAVIPSIRSVARVDQRF